MKAIFSVRLLYLVIGGLVILGALACGPLNSLPTTATGTEQQPAIPSIERSNPAEGATDELEVTAEPTAVDTRRRSEQTSPTPRPTETVAPSVTRPKQGPTLVVSPATTELGEVEVTAKSGLYRDPVSATVSDLSRRLDLPPDSINLISQIPTEVQSGAPCGVTKKDEFGPKPQGLVIGFEILLEANQQQYSYVVQGGLIHFCS